MIAPIAVTETHAATAVAAPAPMPPVGKPRKSRKPRAGKAEKAPAKKRSKPKKPTAPKKTGRPSTYHPKFCNRVIELGSKGKSKTQIAAAIGVEGATLYRWANEHGQFRDALTRAKELELAWWENAGQLACSACGLASTRSPSSSR